MGFGHRVYRTYDPRAKILKAMCERLNPTFYALASKWEEIALGLLQERHPERPQATNVEFYSSGVLQSVGLPTSFRATANLPRRGLDSPRPRVGLGQPPHPAPVRSTRRTRAEASRVRSRKISPRGDPATKSSLAAN